VQSATPACISPDEVLDVSSGQLAKVASLVATSDYGRRVAGLYIASDPWSRMTCVVAEIPNNAWTAGGIDQNWYTSLYLYFYTQVHCNSSSPPHSQSLWDAVFDARQDFALCVIQTSTSSLQQSTWCTIHPVSGPCMIPTDAHQQGSNDVCSGAVPMLVMCPSRRTNLTPSAERQALRPFQVLQAWIAP
jgi:hypothetical protein